MCFYSGSHRQGKTTPAGDTQTRRVLALASLKVHGEEVRGGGRGAVVVGAYLLDELQLSTELTCLKLTIYMNKIIGIISSIPIMIRLAPMSISEFPILRYKDNRPSLSQKSRHPIGK